MSRRQRVWKKIHNKTRQIRKTSLLGVGALCALTAVLFSGGIVRAAGVMASGILQIKDAGIEWELAEPDNTLVYWHRFHVRSEELGLNNTYDPGSSENGDEEADSEIINP